MDEAHKKAQTTRERNQEARTALYRDRDHQDSPSSPPEGAREPKGHTC